MIEEWRVIPGFENYEVSNLGRVYNARLRGMMSLSKNNYGNTKLTMVSSVDGRRYTRSVAQMVAEAFLEPPNPLCDQVVVLDGDLTNLRADNLVWRPASFAWKYVRQMKEDAPIYYENLSVMEMTTGKEYKSIVEACMTEGLLFDDVWRSTYSGKPVFPYNYVFEVTERV